MLKNQQKHGRGRIFDSPKRNGYCTCAINHQGHYSRIMLNEIRCGNNSIQGRRDIHRMGAKHFHRDKIMPPHKKWNMQLLSTNFYLSTLFSNQKDSTVDYSSGRVQCNRCQILTCANTSTTPILLLHLNRVPAVQFRKANTAVAPRLRTVPMKMRSF